jgi:hypothetical protein
MWPLINIWKKIWLAWFKRLPTSDLDPPQYAFARQMAISSVLLWSAQRVGNARGDQQPNDPMRSRLDIALNEDRHRPAGRHATRSHVFRMKSSRAPGP